MGSVFSNTDSVEINQNMRLIYFKYCITILLFFFHNMTIIKEMKSKYNCFSAQFQCCGVQSYTDWYLIDAWPSKKWVPDSCCITQQLKSGCGKKWPVKVYSQGCYSKIHNFFVRKLDIIGIIGMMIAFTQVSKLYAITHTHTLIGNSLYTDFKSTIFK